MSAKYYANTGTETARRRLTEDEAKRGHLPIPYTKAEWRAMHEAVTVYSVGADQRRYATCVAILAGETS